MGTFVSRPSDRDIGRLLAAFAVIAGAILTPIHAVSAGVPPECSVHGIDAGDVSAPDFALVKSGLSGAIRDASILPPRHAGSAAGTTGTHCQVFMSSDGPHVIPDLGMAMSTVNVTATGMPTSVSIVNLKGTHDFMEDLDMYLTSPLDTSVLFFEHACGNDSGFDVSYDSRVTTGSPCPPNDGMRHKPSNPLTPFNGQNPAGVWTLNIVDIRGEDAGTLQAWGLEICFDEPPPTGCESHTSTGPSQPIVDFGMVSSTIHITASGPLTSVSIPNLTGSHTFMEDLDIVLVSPLGTEVIVFDQACGNNDGFNFGLSDSSLDDSPCPALGGHIRKPSNPFSAFAGEEASGPWTLQIFDRQGGDDGQFNHWTLEVCFEGGVQCFTVESEDVPQIIPELGAVFSELDAPFIDVSDPNAIFYRVRAQGLHSFFQDLDFRLTSASGTEVLLAHQKCGNYTGPFDITWDDASPNAAPCPPNPPISSRPDQSFIGTINGELPGGTWILEIDDTQALDAGILNEWSLDICVAEPTPSAPTPTPTATPTPNCKLGEGFGFHTGDSTGGSWSATVMLQDGLFFDNCLADTGGTCTINGRTATWQATLAPFQTGGFDAQWLVEADVPLGTQLCAMITIRNPAGQEVSPSQCIFACGPATPTPTRTPTRTATRTPTHTRTRTATRTHTRTPTRTHTHEPTFTPSHTHQPTFTPTRTHTPTRTPTGTLPPTFTPTRTATHTPTFTQTRTFTPTRTSTPSPTDTQRNKPTFTPTWTATVTHTDTPTPTEIATASPTHTYTETPTFTQPPTFSPSITPTGTRPATFTPTRTPTVTPTFTPTRTATGTPAATSSPTATATDTRAQKPTFTPTATPTFGATFTPTPRNGNPCTGPDECTTGFCVDGVCCETAACPQGQRCNIFGMEGRCAEPGGSGEPCTGPGDCANGFCVDGVCCETSTCPQGQRCDVVGMEGICTEPGGVGQPCTAPADCANGFCVDDVCCETATCPQGQSCNTFGREGSCGPGSGQPCTDPGDCTTGFCTDGVCCESAICPTGERCDIFGMGGRCSPPSGAGQPCADALDCQDGLLCRFSTLRLQNLCTPDGGLCSCVGDCNCDGSVTVDEIITMVSIALGTLDPISCLMGDANRDGMITVDEIITAVTNALSGCPAPPPTPTPTVTPTSVP